MTIGSEAVIVSIHVSETKGAPLLPLSRAELLAGQGIVGDKRCMATAKAKNQVTLIEEEALQAATLATQVAVKGFTLEPGLSRRNIVTRGVALNHLVGRRFVVGGALLQGIELCEPCGHLARCTHKSFRQALEHRGGLRAEVLRSGACAVGDAVRPES